MQARSDTELRALTDIFRARLVEGEDLDEILPEAFAAVREAAVRTLGQRHYDVQLIGGAVLHGGNIAEMKTGEGKTLVATLPAYVNALSGDGVHVITVNDYLAKRDAEWMGRIYRFLGLTVGLIQANMRPEERRPAYAADITYGTNNEFGFDYLRDNMAWTADERVQRGHNFGIVDEVDSILIDEARTPLIISGPSEESAKWYRTFSRLVPRLRADLHYEVDEKKRTVAVTEEGVHEIEKMLGIENLYDQISSPLVHYMQNALRAKELYKRDVDYLVTNGEVKIVDEFTGRVLEGRRYSEGMHQAIEAKENVRIKEENVTLATITIQNYFRMYETLSGMTGTALTEAAEFEHIYKMGVVEIPPNRDVVRDDRPDVVYKNEEGKFQAAAHDIAERYERGQPVLVGTVSIEKSERLAKLLDRQGIPHSVLNAKQHEREAHIIAQAGKRGSVTVATNMAGRGVDIILGGNPEHEIKLDLEAQGLVPETEDYDRELDRRMEASRETWEKEHQAVLDVGGLYVLGTERHESRRIDNQLRGRSGRQGDPGASRFYLSLEDDLMRLFATGMVERMMNSLKIPDDMPIESKLVTRSIQRAQHQREQQNFEIRKNVLKYDDVINKQREAIYKRRNEILDGEDFEEQAEQWIHDVVESVVLEFANPDIQPEEWDIEGLTNTMRTIYPTALTPQAFELETLTTDELTERFNEEALEVYDRRADEIGEEEFRNIERRVLLSVLDSKWREHLYEMDYLQEGIGLRAIGQRDPHVPRAGGTRAASRAAGDGAAVATAVPKGSGRRRGSAGGDGDGALGQGPAQRAVPVRQRQEVQEVPRAERLSARCRYHDRHGG
ncbi:MAG: preprotein translocase subunit SecA [Actinobacteria bacterium]|nr:MAG: preprotein translocase subunit SecA [Actinomycetota bacterium]